MTTTPAALLAELTRLRRENENLRRRVAQQEVERQKMRIVRIIDRAHLDALGLVTVYIGGGSINRHLSPLPQRRWCYAAALLRFAGLTGRKRDLAIKTVDQHIVITNLDQAVHLAKVHPVRFLSLVPAYNGSSLQKLAENVAALERNRATRHSHRPPQ